MLLCVCRYTVYIGNGPAIVTRKPNCKTGWRLEFPNMTHFDCYLTFLSQRFTSLYWETYCHFVKYYFLHDIHVWCFIEVLLLCLLKAI